MCFTSTALGTSRQVKRYYKKNLHTIVLPPFRTSSHEEKRKNLMEYSFLITYSRPPTYQDRRNVMSRSFDKSVVQKIKLKARLY